jgi:hypothetical protein
MSRKKNLLSEVTVWSFFYYLEAGALTKDQAPPILSENLKDIEDLIINKKFLPFPSRSRVTPEYQSPPEGETELYLSKDGYENYHQINLILRAILIHPELVIL